MFFGLLRVAWDVLMDDWREFYSEMCRGIESKDHFYEWTESGSGLTARCYRRPWESMDDCSRRALFALKVLVARTRGWGAGDC